MNVIGKLTDPLDDFHHLIVWESDGNIWWQTMTGPPRRIADEDERLHAQTEIMGWAGPWDLLPPPQSKMWREFAGEKILLLARIKNRLAELAAEAA